MPYFLYLFVALFAVYGLVALIVPLKAKQLRRAFAEALPNWGIGVISLIVAVFLWYASVSTLSPGFVQFLAVLAGLKGLAYLILPKSKMERLKRWWFNLPDVYFRFIGLVLVFIAFYLYQIIY